MPDLKTFEPETASEFVDRLEEEIGADLQALWNTHRARIARNLKTLGEITIRTKIALAAEHITAGDADAIIYQQEQLFNATLNNIRTLPYVAAQSILNTIFKVVGWAIYNGTGVNLFPALVRP